MHYDSVGLTCCECEDEVEVSYYSSGPFTCTSCGVQQLVDTDLDRNDEPRSHLYIAKHEAMIPRAVWVRLPAGEWTLKEIAEWAGCSTHDAAVAMHQWFGKRDGPRYVKEKDAIVYPYNPGPRVPFDNVKPFAGKAR
jgi:hypothetical protein